MKKITTTVIAALLINGSVIFLSGYKQKYVEKFIYFEVE